MPRPPRPLPDELGEAFRSHAAHAMGVTQGRLRARDLGQPFRGVRLRPETAMCPDDDSDVPGGRQRRERRILLRTARAYREVMAPGTFFAGRTALGIYDVPFEYGDELTVAAFPPQHAPRRAGIQGVKVARSLVSVREHEGLLVTSPASTWAMLASELTVRELVVIGDALVRVPRTERGIQQPHGRLATIEQLRRAATAARRRHAEKLIEALSLIRVGSMSPLESEFRLDAGDAGLPEPELDVEIRDAGGRLLGISELVHRPYRTIVEVEGDHHRTSKRQWDRDIEKYRGYVAEGWEVVRLTSRHIRGRDPESVAIVRDALVRHGWRPESAYQDVPVRAGTPGGFPPIPAPDPSRSVKRGQFGRE